MERKDTAYGRIIELPEFKYSKKTWNSPYEYLVIHKKDNLFVVSTEGIISFNENVKTTVYHPSTAPSLSLDCQEKPKEGEIACIILPVQVSMFLIDELAEKSDRLGDVASFIRTFGDRLERNYYNAIGKLKELGYEVVKVREEKAA